MSMVQYRPLGFGEVLDAAFSLYRRHFFPFFLTALIPAVPMSLASGVLSFQTMADPTSPPFLALLVVMVVSALGVLVQWGALTREVSQAYTGGEVSVGDGFRAGLRAFLPLLGMLVLTYVAIFALLLVIMLPLGIAGALLTDGSETATLAVGGVGFLVMLALFLLLGAAMFAVVPAVVLERCGPVAAIRRSFQLSAGARMRLMGIVVVGWIIVFLPVLGIGVLTGSLTQLATGQPPTSTGVLFIQQVFGLLGSALTTPFWVGSLVMAYFDRRIRTEALDLHVAADTLAPA